MTLPDLSLNGSQLQSLGVRLGDCDFSGDPQRKFLESMDSCDVQAAPGSGKTTLLVAKLVHVHERWSDAKAGICVLSHTNAARREVESKLGTVALSELTAHPHFVGTVTTFVHRFMALPFIRGLRWPVSHIDNDRYEAAAVRLVSATPFLRKQHYKQDQFKNFARRLVISDQLDPTRGLPPTRCPIGDIAKMPGAGTPTRKAFEEIKGTLLREGIYRYEDLTVMANKALAACPVLAEHLRNRFALVLLDEAQDTSAAHLGLLGQVFGDAVVQRLGDSNQTLFDDDAGWEPDKDAIDLGSSRRFSTPIADFASMITARRQQTILGVDPDEQPLQPALISYSKDSPQNVLPTFAQLVHDELPAVVHDELPAGANSWVVSWVHRPSGSESAVSLQTYVHEYRPPTGPRLSSDSLFEIISAACHVSKAGGDLAGPVRNLRKGLLRLLRSQGVNGVSAIWAESVFKRWLSEKYPAVAGNIDRLLVEILVSDVASFALAENWDTNAQRVVAVLSPLLGDETRTKATKTFLALPSEVKTTAQDVLGLQRASFGVGHDTTINLNLGSVASVKGCTHDATLVVQTTAGNVRDIKTALELAIGKRNRKDLGPNLLRGVTNVFVGATRPRYLVCLALPVDDLTEEIKKGLDDWKWRIIEATA